MILFRSFMVSLPCRAYINQQILFYLMQGLIKITKPPDYSYKTSFLFLPDLLIKIKHYGIYNFTFSGRLQLS